MGDTMGNQTHQILHHLKTRKSITAVEALNLYGSFRLAARIKDLRDTGHHIETTMIDIGNDRRIAQYRLIATKDANF
jgi:hypothetical protein